MSEPSAWAYARPVIEPYDPQWAAWARHLRSRLTEVLRPWLSAPAEHVGSTAVPGLAAKPIIDLMVGVVDLDTTVTQAHDVLAADGWCYVPVELDGRDWRRFFVWPDESGTRRVAHLHLLAAGDPRWHDQLAFRDALRTNSGLASRYERLKRRLAQQHADDREAYTEAKSAFIAAVLRPAR